MATKLPELVRDSRLETILDAESTTHLYHDRPGRRSLPRRETWRRERILGSGGNGVVWLERLLSDGGGGGASPSPYRALKQITSTKPDSLLELCKFELEALAKFSTRKYARCFVQSFGWYEAADSVSITMEYCPNGDLQNYLAQNKQLSEVDTQEIISQVVEGLSFMHEEGFAHRDLKPTNILIKSFPPADHWWVKICDLGLTKRIEGIIGNSTTVKGTPGFLAPELLGFDDSDPRRADQYALDIWCLGEMTYRMLSGNATFSSYGQLRNYQLGISAFPRKQLQDVGAGDTSISFIISAMIADPKSRFTVYQASAHEWLRMTFNADCSSTQTRSRPTGSLPSYNDLKPPILLSTEPSGSWSTITGSQIPAAILLRTASTEEIGWESMDAQRKPIPSQLSCAKREPSSQIHSVSPRGYRRPILEKNGVVINEGNDDYHTQTRSRGSYTREWPSGNRSEEDRPEESSDSEKSVDSANRIQGAAATSFIAGATEAFRANTRSGSSAGEKMARSLAAVSGAASIESLGYGGEEHQNEDELFKEKCKAKVGSVDSAKGIPYTEKLDTSALQAMPSDRYERSELTALNRRLDALLTQEINHLYDGIPIGQISKPNSPFIRYGDKRRRPLIKKAPKIRPLQAVIVEQPGLG